MLRRILRTGIVSEPASEPAARARRRARDGRACSDEILRILGRALTIRAGRRRLLQRLRAGDPRAEQSLHNLEGYGISSSPARATPTCCWSPAR
jgi:hypothetical protein